MDNNDYKMLITEYEKLNIERPDMYPLSFNEYTDRLNNSFSKPNYLTAPKEKQIKVALLWMRDGCSLMKYYNAFKAKDMVFLNNILFETAHMMQISNISSTGTDHGFYGMNITPNLLAANMMDKIKLVLPEENGLGNSSFSGTHIANLLMAVIYKDFEFKRQALELSEKELNKKVPEYVKCWIRCMRAIVLKNCDVFNEQLVAFCKAYTICNKIMRCEPPKMFLKGEGKKRVIDVHRFAQDVVLKIE